MKVFYLFAALLTAVSASRSAARPSERSFALAARLETFYESSYRRRLFQAIPEVAAAESWMAFIRRTNDRLFDLFCTEMDKDGHVAGTYLLPIEQELEESVKPVLEEIAAISPRYTDRLTKRYVDCLFEEWLHIAGKVMKIEPRSDPFVLSRFEHKSDYVSAKKRLWSELCADEIIRLNSSLGSFVPIFDEIYPVKKYFDDLGVLMGRTVKRKNISCVDDRLFEILKADLIDRLLDYIPSGSPFPIEESVSAILDLMCQKFEE